LLRNEKFVFQFVLNTCIFGFEGGNKLEKLSYMISKIMKNRSEKETAI